jgi:hypothetical protein
MRSILCLTVAAATLCALAARSVSQTTGSAEPEALALNLHGESRTGDPEDFRLDRIEIDNDGTWLRVRVPIGAPWADWTLSRPPRIVIDLGSTVSHLPKAPGLYSIRLDRGPLLSLRTSQYRYEPLDHRVRITLELGQPLAYQAKRVGGEIQILIPDAASRPPVILGSSGLSMLPGESSESAPPLRGGVPESGSLNPLARPAEQRRPARTLREALENAAPQPPPKVADAVEAGRPSQGDSPAEISLSPSRDADMEALASVLSAANQAFDVPPPAEPLQNEITRKVAEATAGVRPRQTRAASLRVAPAHETKAEEAGRGKAGHGVPEEAAKEPAKVAAAAMPSDAHEEAAAKLLASALGEFLEGGPEKAEPLAERCYRFYAGTPSGGQAGLFLRELLIMAGREIEADQMTGIPSVPDTFAIPSSAFRKLIRSVGEEDLLEAERLLKEWAPAYGTSPWMSALRLRAAEALFDAGKPEEARHELESIPPGDPLESRALLLLARIHDEAGEKAKAIELYERVSILPSGPYRMRGLARLADLQFQTGLVNEALENYERLLQEKPPADEEPWAVYQTANCRLILGDAGQARIRYEMVAERWPGSFWAPFARDRLEELKWREHLSGKSAESRIR